MNSFFLAWQFLTILPGWKSKDLATPRLLGQSLTFYPLSGLFHRHALRQLAGECDEEFSEDLSRQDPTLRTRQEVQHD